MGLDRPPRSPAGALTDRVRGAILEAAKGCGIAPRELLALHAEAEHLAPPDILHDVEERYLLVPDSLNKNLHRRAKEWAAQGRYTAASPFSLHDYGEKPQQRVMKEHGAELVLLELPDPEFLTTLEHAAVSLVDPLSAGGGEELLAYADGALRAHGVPYRRVPGTAQFEWVGDPAQHALTVQPALVALTDRRLAGGPRDDFERALRKRRLGAPKDLEDAIVAAARSVESVLKVLHDERGVQRPSKQDLASLFNRLAHKDVHVLPGYVDHLVLAAGGPRNQMGSHGPGPDVRQVPEELADASIAAAATAITLLAHYLP